ncbi:hypothetical protein RclHR1_00270031 [Rhizophagus clarus]|uniref:Uncharacterized protein n=1 Tax=Rhizophagus clarus TaxID=94130 RepID=A0A2Z6R2J8_9GLOM|nr:hypothetical protein RclHR1_00270031 [Rhizophagus clarus]
MSTIVLMVGVGWNSGSLSLKVTGIIQILWEINAAKNLEISISASTEVVFQTDPEGVYGHVPEKCIMTYLEPGFGRKMKQTMSSVGQLDNRTFWTFVQNSSKTCTKPKPFFHWTGFG